MSSPDDLKQLTSEAGRDRMADAIAAGVTQFFAHKGAAGHQAVDDGAPAPGR